MRKKIFWMFLIIVSIILIYFYSYVDQSQNIFDENQLKNTDTTSEVISNKSINQYLVYNYESLSGLMIKCHLDEDNYDGIIYVEVLDSNSMNILASGEKELKNILNDKYFEVKFDKIEDLKGKEIVIKISCKGENSPKFYKTKSTNENTLLYYGDMVENGTLLIKTIENKFDFRTFIIVISFEVYIIFFVRLLYKLFK